jgi:hypothetical protein
MEITKTSILTGITHTREIPITKEEYKNYLDGDSIHIAAPHLIDEDKDFIRTGITIEEMETTFE